METSNLFDAFSGVGFRFLWKTIELLMVAMLATIMPIAEFGKALFFIIMLSLLVSAFKISFESNNAKNIKKFYNALTVFSIIVGVLVLSVFIGLSFIIKSYQATLLIGGLVFFLSSLTLTPLQFFKSRQQYTKIYKNNVIAQFVMSILTISLALSGFDHKGVLVGYAVYYFGSTILLWSSFPFRIKLTFSRNFFVSYINYAKKNATNAILSSLLYEGILIFVWFNFGPESFAILYLTLFIGMFLYHNVTLFLNTLLVPTFEEMIHNIEKTKINLVRVTEYYAIIVIPVSTLLIMMSKEITLVLGFRWERAFEILILLVLAGFLKSLAESNKLVLRHKSTIIFNRIRIIEIVTFIVITLFTMKYDILGISIALFFSSFASSLLYVLSAIRILKLDITAMSRDFLYILFSGIMTALFVGIIKEIFEIETYISLGLCFCVGLIFFFGLTVLLNPSLYKRFVQFIYAVNEKY